MMNVFHKEPYQREVKTEIVALFEEDGLTCVQVEENIYHPHGGGQKGDRGVLIIGDKTIAVVNTIKDKYSEEGVLLVTKDPLDDELKGSAVVCKIDWDFRYNQMKLHTAVHLHHCMLEKAAGKRLQPPKTSDIQEGFAFNRYESKEITAELVAAANKLFCETVAAGAPVKTYPDQTKAGFRWWECLEYKIPCGGTHVGDLSEIGTVDFEFSKKSGKSTVNISLKVWS